MTAGEPHPQEHCGHECVCGVLMVHDPDPEHKAPCTNPYGCIHDTRSHAAAPVPTGDDTQKTISALISENARLGAELKESNRLVELFSGKHDAEVARAERERVLHCDDVTCYSTVLFELQELLQYINPESPAGKIIARRYDELWKARESLRSGEGVQHGK